MLASHSVVFVLNGHGRPLMPCHPARARQLLKQGKAEVVSRTPFQIRLVFGSSGYRQPVSLGADPGYSHLGLSAVTASREVYAAEVLLREDMVKLNAERAQYRRGRRSRHTWYRKARFLNRKKPEGWCAPSIRNKRDIQIKAVEQVKRLLPVKSIAVEAAAFDIQKIRNPEISGVDYRNGPQRDFWNVREYVLYRDGHKCQHCKGKSKDHVLEVHHVESRQTGGDRPDNLLTLCMTCHAGVSRGEIVLKALRPSMGFKAETFMTMVRWQMIDQLRAIGNTVSYTYGHITKSARIALGFAKSHINDAFVIAGGQRQERLSTQLVIKQVRKCNRKLRKGDRSHIPNTAPRFLHGFQRYDKVRWNGHECFIFGRRSSGYFDLRRLDGEKVSASAKASDIVLLESARTLLAETRSGSSLWQDHRVSAA